MQQQQHKRRTSAGDLAHLRELFRHHIESFDYLVSAGLMLRDIKPVQVDNPLTGETLRIWFADDPILGRPLKDRSTEPLYPFECRQTRISYTGKLLADIYFQRGDKAPVREQFNFGQFPIMLMSKCCNLRGHDPQQLVSCKEESSEMGGYFILNGLERVIRPVILPKRNYPMSTVRNSFRDRKEGYTDKAVVISLHGKYVDATPFANSEKKVKEETNGEKSKTLVDELGEMLKVKGFNYNGAEVLYSGVYGTELTCEIFIGPVYYQRLRHMVSDKFQVRSTGMVDQVTRQPIKGRKRGGGIRFGEMERDSLLAHGAAYLLHDRLHTCSDYHIADVCSLCGSILTTSSVQPPVRVREIPGMPPMRAPKKVTCHACKTSKGMETVAMPYVFRYLAAELAAMNIKLNLQLSNASGA
ncbi:hypothetical protein ACLB2K_052849 [Fragaria x ananassa]